MNAELFRTDPRDYALELVEQVAVSADTLLTAALKYMSHDDCREMLDMNELSPRFDEDEPDEEDEEPEDDQDENAPAPLDYPEACQMLGYDFHRGEEWAAYEITEEAYWWGLECVPPMIQRGRSYICGEPWSHDNEGRAIAAAGVQIGEQFFLFYSTAGELPEKTGSLNIRAAIERGKQRRPEHDVRARFWEEHPDTAQFHRNPRKTQNDYPADVRAAWVDWLDEQHRAGLVDDDLAADVTL